MKLNISPVPGLLKILSRHVGAARCVPAARIAERLKVAPRVVPELVLQMRLQGIVICGDRRAGYFIAATPDELKATCNQYRDEAMLALLTEARLRHVTLLELLQRIAAEERRAIERTAALERECVSRETRSPAARVALRGASEPRACACEEAPQP